MTGGGAGMTWSAGMTRKGEGIAGSTVMTGSVEMRVDTEVAPEACNSSPGNANRPIGTQAGHDEDKPPGFAAEICPATYLPKT